jgi:hypothetical protein
MQLRLTTEEFELLAQIQREENRMSCSETPTRWHAASDVCLRDKLLIGGDLSGKRISGNLPLAFDELQDLADSLNWHERKLMADLARSEDATSNSKLENNLAVLEHLLEKVNEACAMV